MGLLKQLKSIARSKDSSSNVQNYDYQNHYLYNTPAYDFTKRLPDTVVDLIFSYVCPHSTDMSYTASESSPVGGGCMLCDLRDLASCMRVNKRWWKIAQQKLYTSIRIDAVHYCPLEEELAVKRKKAAKHFRKGSYLHPEEIPGSRLVLLCRTVRETRYLAHYTQLLKLPYQTRESNIADLAMTVAALPNLKYVDLPEEFFSGAESCLTLREELQAQCPAIVKMIYRRGSERHLEFLLQRRWQQLEVLELEGIAIDAPTLRYMLASLPNLRELTLSRLSWLDDSAFEQIQAFPDFPPVLSLTVTDVPRLTAQGLLHYLARSECKEALLSLTLHNTGVALTELHSVLWRASSLLHLSIADSVSQPIVMGKDQPLLTSISLGTLNFEIDNAKGVTGMQQPAESYYAYLAASLHASALPALSTLYVRERHFPERLIVPPGGVPQNPTNKSFSVYSQMAPVQHSSFNQTLEVYSRGIDEVEWIISNIAPPVRDHRFSTISTGRPISSYSTHKGLGPDWARGGMGGEARKSVIVGNGAGAHLVVPDDDARAGAHEDDWLKPPPSMGSLTGSPKLVAKRGSRGDLWR